VNALPLALRAAASRSAAGYRAFIRHDLLVNKACWMYISVYILKEWCHIKNIQLPQAMHRTIVPNFTRSDLKRANDKALGFLNSEPQERRTVATRTVAL